MESIDRISVDEFQAGCRPNKPLIVTGLLTKTHKAPSLRSLAGWFGSTTHDLRYFETNQEGEGEGGEGEGGGEREEKQGEGRHRQVTDCSMSLTFAEYAKEIESGKAKAMDLYWAYSTPGYAFERAALANTRFAEAEERVAGFISWLESDGDQQYGLDIAEETKENSGAGAGAMVERESEGERESESLSVWVGACAHIERLHYDDEDNLHMMISGSKRWLLFEPRLTLSLELGFLNVVRLLWQYPAGTIMKDGVGGDPASTDVNPHSLEAIAIPHIDTVLTAGEALWVPAGWAHQVEEVGNENGFTFSVNRFYQTALFRVLLRGLSAAWCVARLRFYHWYTSWRNGGATSFEPDWEILEPLSLPSPSPSPSSGAACHTHTEGGGACTSCGLQMRSPSK